MNQNHHHSQQEQLSHLIHMANQIAQNIAPMGSPDTCADRVLDHISKFWAKPMREQIINALGSIDAELEPAALDAVRKLASA